MRVVALLSGGLDSTALVAFLRAQGDEVAALSVNYGQRHARELEAAAAVAAALGVEHQVADLTHLRQLMQGSSQTDPSVVVPHGHYAEESMKVTVVPNRNMVLLACAIAWAVARKADAVAYAAHAGDHAIYPDCRGEFVAAMQQAAALCDWRPVDIIAPFTAISKADIVQIGVQDGAPLGLTWSCYEGGTVHCGRCGTCVERREAFQLAGVADPTEYLP